MIAKVAGLPPLDLMQGFYNADVAVMGNPFWKQYEEDKRNAYDGPHSVWAALPIKWECLKPSPLHTLLHHSDCDGEIAWQECGAIADELEKLIPLLPQAEDSGHIGNWRDKTDKFIAGLRAAHAAQENVEFH